MEPAALSSGPHAGLGSSINLRSAKASPPQSAVRAGFSIASLLYLSFLCMAALVYALPAPPTPPKGLYQFVAPVDKTGAIRIGFMRISRLRRYATCFGGCGRKLGGVVVLGGSLYGKA
jgi:hypothetical protein